MGKRFLRIYMIGKSLIGSAPIFVDERFWTALKIDTGCIMVAWVQEEGENNLYPSVAMLPIGWFSDHPYENQPSARFFRFL